MDGEGGEHGHPQGAAQEAACISLEAPQIAVPHPEVWRAPERAVPHPEVWRTPERASR